MRIELEGRLGQIDYTWVGGDADGFSSAQGIGLRIKNSDMHLRPLVEQVLQTA